MVEDEDVRVNYYFALDNSVVRIKADDLRLMPSLATDLQPLRITGGRLFSLQFTPVFGSNNTIWEKSFGGITVRLKATNSDRWLVELDKTGKLRYVQYVHQLQDMWRGLFDEPLQRRVGDIKVEVPVLKLRPEYQVSVVSEKKKSAYPSATFAFQPQQFYLTWDCLFVVCTMPLVVWKVVEDDAYYNWGGRNWGFQCVYGKVDKKLTDKAAEWVRGELVSKRMKS